MDGPDTDIGGRSDRFPATRHTLIAAAGSADPAVRQAAREALIAAYWKPAYKYLRLRWREPSEDAKDLTQAFLARALEKGFFDRYDPSKARFRTYLRTCLDGFVAHERTASSRQKRGGDADHVPLDFDAAEGELAGLQLSDGVDPEALFQREWVRSLFGLAVEELRRWCHESGKAVHFTLFERYDLDAPTSGEKVGYAELGAQLGLSATQVTNYLAAVRRQLRKIVLAKLEELSGSEAEFQAEAREILGVDPK